MWGQTDSRSIFKPPKLQKIVWRLTFHHLQICFLLTRLSLSILLLLQSLTVMHCNLTRLNCLGLSDRFSFVWREQERNANQFYVDQFSEIDFYWTVFVVYTFYNNKKFVLNWEIFSFIYFYFGNTLSAFILFESS